MLLIFIGLLNCCSPPYVALLSHIVRFQKEKTQRKVDTSQNNRMVSDFEERELSPKSTIAK